MAAPRAETPDRLALSILIPVYNEVDNVEPLHAELDAVLRGAGPTYEIIFVDDGSTDGTALALDALFARDPDHVRVARLRHNGGQTAALSAALDLARGEVLIPMDGDQQDELERCVGERQLVAVGTEQVPRPTPRALHAGH